MPTPQELRLQFEIVQTHYAAEQLSMRVREELETLQEVLHESKNAHPDLDYDEIEDDIVDFAILAFGGCY
jgi:hypothetical protein